MEPAEARLRAAVARDPSDLAARLVYADWLLDRGHPLGELISLDHGAELDAWSVRGTSNEIARERARLLELSADELFGSFAPYADKFNLRWWLGLIRSVRFKRATTQHLRTLRSCPVGCAVEEISFSGVARGNKDFQNVIDWIAKYGFPARLKSLQLEPLNHAIGTLADVWPALQHLEVLECSGSVQLGLADAPRLRRLAIGGRLDELALDCLGESWLPSLETLDISVHHRDEIALGRLLQRLPETLTSLTVRGPRRVAPVLARILAAGELVERLESLAVTGRVDLEAYNLLVANAMRIAHLRRLTFERKWQLRPEQIQDIRALCGVQLRRL